ncbi:transposase domain-containing protein, partial [Profundibacterium mesophilum]
EARFRLRVVQAVMASTRSGLTRSQAVTQISYAEAKSARTIWSWLGMTEGVAAADWLMCLAPAYATGARARASADTSDFMELVTGDFLRLEAPSLATCYRRAVRVAEARGLATLPLHTVRRRIKAEIPRATQIYRREGYTGLAKCFPPQIRDRSSLHALEAVNADCHRFDVFVNWPGMTTPTRAQIVAFQDVYSGKILSWRIDHTPNKVMVMAAFGDLVEEWGIPQHCLFDNGREFANKWMTGGAKTRFRFTVRDDDPAGVMTLMGIELHWATPGHGQAKPIERAFRDFAD